MREPIELYIGPDVDSGEPDVERIIEILKSRHDRFVIKGIVEGYWRGYPEDTFVVLIMDIAETISETIEILKKELTQVTIAAMSADELKLV